MPDLSEIEQACPRLVKLGESATAYRAFCDVALSQKSLRDLMDEYLQASNEAPTKPPTRHWNTLCTWSKKYSWQERAATWRSHFLKLREQRMLDEWDNHRNQMISQAKRLQEKAAEMLTLPLLQQEIKKVVTASHAGEEIPTQIIIKPARWNMQSAAQFLQVASDLMRLAVGDVETEIEHLTRLGYLVLDPNDLQGQREQEKPRMNGHLGMPSMGDRN